MARLKQWLSSAAGPGIVASIIFLLMLIFDNPGSAFILGFGVGTMADPVMLVALLVGFMACRKWHHVLAVFAIAIPIAWFIRDPAIDDFHLQRRLIGFVSCFMVGSILIAIIFAARQLFARK